MSYWLLPREEQRSQIKLSSITPKYKHINTDYQKHIPVHVKKLSIICLQTLHFPECNYQTIVSMNPADP